MKGVGGLVAQGTNARKTTRQAFLRSIDTVSGTSSFTATSACTLFAYAWGAAGSGAFSSAQVASGAGGGSAGYKRIKLTTGQTVSWTIGAGGADQNTDNTDGFDGSDTTVTLPNGVVLTAGAGKKGVQGASPKTGGLGGLCAGPWDVARSGGNGGDGVTGAGTAGGSPAGGGTGGIGSGNYGGGGAAAGFSDLVPGLPIGGNGANGNATPDLSTAPGGATSGAAAATSTFAGKDGRLVIFVVQMRT